MEKSEAVLVGLLVISAFLLGVHYTDSSRMPSVSKTESASANIVAVAEDRPKGIIGEVKVKLEPGNGDVLVETDPFVQANTQLSANKALKVAEAYTGKRLDRTDVTYKFNISSEVVGGPSAGAAMTLATIAAIEDRKVRQEAAITGTITRSGEIGKVGEVQTKARAAGKAGLKSFYVPEGQSVKVNYQRVLDRERKGLFIYQDIEYRRTLFNISEYTVEKYGMKTKEVSNISEAAEKLLKDS